MVCIFDLPPDNRRLCGLGLFPLGLGAVALPRPAGVSVWPMADFPFSPAS